jgi:hypothetical protein
LNLKEYEAKKKRALETFKKKGEKNVLWQLKKIVMHVKAIEEKTNWG